MNIVDPRIQTYMENCLPPRNPLFKELEKKAEDDNFPAVGPQVGFLLEMIARSIKARTVMELGSGFGYSGLWFARALQPEGKLILTDFNKENQELAETFFKRAGFLSLMEFRVGDALELLEVEAGPLDIIFNDVDKQDYPRVIPLAYDRLRPGGYLITDNTLWYGKVAEPEPDQTTKAILEFNRKLQEHKGFLTVPVPIRDGISLSLKI
jgi:predicted O-methyltransferase YrrM